MTSNHTLTAVLKGRTITGTQLALDFEHGGTMFIQLAEATSSVMVRAKDHTLEDADERARKETGHTRADVGRGGDGGWWRRRERRPRSTPRR